MRQEISRLRVSSKRFPSTPPIPARSSARDDGGGGRLSRHFDGGSGVETSYASNSRNAALHPSCHFDRSGEEWRNLTPPWSREHGGRRSLDSEYHRSGFHLPPYRHVPSLEMTVAAGTPLVISTVAGQPPIGKPLIVQARGQLRLTWRLYAESPQSGEISLHQ